MDFGNVDSSGMDGDSMMEDLLKAQEVFMSRNDKPSAKAIRVQEDPGCKQRESPLQGKKKSLFSQRAEKHESDSNAAEKNVPACQAVPLITGIVEKNTAALPTPMPLPMPMPSNSVMNSSQKTGFPPVLQRPPGMLRSSTQYGNVQGLDLSRKNADSQKKKAVSFGSDESLYAKKDGRKKASFLNEIDKENTEKLEAMSVDEIEDAQAALLASLSPELVANLRRRGREKTTATAAEEIGAKGHGEGRQKEGAAAMAAAAATGTAARGGLPREAGGAGPAAAAAAAAPEGPVLHRGGLCGCCPPPLPPLAAAAAAAAEEVPEGGKESLLDFHGTTVAPAELVQRNQFVNLAGCDLKCLVCGRGLKGQAGALEHARATSHQNFGQI